MNFYRLYLFADGHLLVGQDFLAENDDIASGIAAVVVDGCSEECDKFELWDGTRIVANDLALHARAIMEKVEQAARRTLARIDSAESSFESLRESLENSAAALEESAMVANGSLARSEKLNARLVDIRKNRR